MRILVVEDDRRLARSLATSLREQAYAVDVSASVSEALYQIAVNDYDVVVLDRLLPDGDGIAVAKVLRERESRVRILMLTARDQVTDRVAGLDAGADDYVVKPVALVELHARIRALLRRADDLHPVVLEVGDLSLDTSARTVRRGGNPIALTTREYALLEFLARNAGRVVGRTEISEHVWDDRYDPASNLIEVYVSRLRDKTEMSGARRLIHTRRGAGYVLLDSEAAPGPT